MAQAEPTLRHINLDIYPGEKVLIAGTSGSGKSTVGVDKLPVRILQHRPYHMA